MTSRAASKISLLDLGNLLGGASHYYRNLNRGGQKALTEAVFATASERRPRLIVVLTEMVAKTVSVNALTEVVFYNSTASVNRIKN